MSASGPGRVHTLGPKLPILDVCCPVAIEGKEMWGGHPILVATQTGHGASPLFRLPRA